jgi:hypothetical protein
LVSNLKGSDNNTYLFLINMLVALMACIFILGLVKNINGVMATLRISFAIISSYVLILLVLVIISSSSKNENMNEIVLSALLFVYYLLHLLLFSLILLGNRRFIRFQNIFLPFIVSAISLYTLFFIFSIPLDVFDDLSWLKEKSYWTYLVIIGVSVYIATPLLAGFKMLSFFQSPQKS